MLPTIAAHKLCLIYATALSAVSLVQPFRTSRFLGYRSMGIFWWWWYNEIYITRIRARTGLQFIPWTSLKNTSLSLVTSKCNTPQKARFPLELIILTSTNEKTVIKIEMVVYQMMLLTTGISLQRSQTIPQSSTTKHLPTPSKTFPKYYRTKPIANLYWYRHRSSAP